MDPLEGLIDPLPPPLSSGGVDAKVAGSGKWSGDG